MGPLILGAALALAGPLQEVAELEWGRAEAESFSTYLKSDDAMVRRAAARALGRLRDPEAAAVIGAMRQADGAPEEALAHALALTPGSAQRIREWLAETPEPEVLAGRASSEGGVRQALILGLGLQGESADVPRLAEIVSEPWPHGAAAAHALGLLKRRKVEGVHTAVPDLLRAVARPDPRTRDMAAWALSRIGLDEARDVEVAFALRHVESTVGRRRAWLLQAVWGRLTSEQRAHWLDTAMEGPSRTVLSAVVGGVADGDVPLSTLTALLEHEDPWVRHQAVSALGRMGDDAAKRLIGYAEDAPWEREHALDMLVRTDLPLELDTAYDTEADPRIRAGWVGGIDDVETLVLLATGDDSSVVRTAAVARLLMLESPPPDDVPYTLLESEDPVVREAALALLKSREPTRPEDLVVHLRVETDELVLAEGLATLTTWARSRRRSVVTNDLLEQVLERAYRHRTARVRRAAAELAEAVGVQLEEAEPVASDREVVLPSGDVEAVSGDQPVIAEVQAIASARVLTSRGEVRIDLRPDVAPLAVSNFARLAEADYFDGLVWHRVVPGFVVQTGDPRGDGWGGPGWTIPDEVSLMPFEAGAVGMARAALDTGGSQWFVTTEAAPHLTGGYTWFGHITHGLHVARSIERGDIVEDVIIERVNPERR